MVARRRAAGLRRGRPARGRAFRHRRPGPARAARRCVFPTRAPGRANAQVRLGIVPAGPPRGARPRRCGSTGTASATPTWPGCCGTASGRRSPCWCRRRDQREVALLAVDAASGGTRAAVTESDEAWVNLDRDLPRWLPDGSGLLWASERSGGRALELRRPDGRLRARVAGRPIEGSSRSCHVTAGLAARCFVLEGGPVGNRLDADRARASGRRQVLTDDAAEHAPALRAGGPALRRHAAPIRGRLPRSVVVHDASGAEVARAAGRGRAAALRGPARAGRRPRRRAGFHAALVRPRDFDRRPAATRWCSTSTAGPTA